MKNPLLIINGYDFSGYIKPGGYQWKRNDIDSDKAGRVTMEMKMYRDRRAMKSELTIECRPLTGAEAKRLLLAIEPEFVTISYLHPAHGRQDNVEFYSNNVPASYMFRKPDGTLWWDGIKFPLVER